MLTANRREQSPVPFKNRQINWVPQSPMKPRKRKSCRQTNALRNAFIVQAKMMRVFKLIIKLQTEKKTIKQLAEHFDQSERTIYRYINLLDALDISIDKDFNGMYFIAADACPLCGSEVCHA